MISTCEAIINLIRLAAQDKRHGLMKNALATKTAAPHALTGNPYHSPTVVLAPPSDVLEDGSERLLDSRDISLHKVGKVHPQWQLDADHRDTAHRLKTLKYVMSPSSPVKWSWERIARFRDCGKPFQTVVEATGEIEDRRQFCKDTIRCPTCSRIRTRQLRHSIERDIPIVEEENRERVTEILPTIGQTQLQLADIVNRLQCIKNTPYGSVTAEKTALREDLKRVVERLSSIKHQIHFTPIRIALNKSREAIRGSGQPAEALDYLTQVRERLSGELNYTWKHIVVTIVNHGNGRQEEAVEALCDALPRFHRSQLIRSCYALTSNKEIGGKGNVHAHLLYYGPDIEHAQLKESWMKFTTNANHPSEVVWIEQAYNDDRGDLDAGKAVFEAIKYTTKTYSLTPEQLIDYGQAIKGRRRFTRYGAFRNRQQKRERTVIGVRVNPDKGKDVIFDTRLNARTCRSKAEIILS